MNGEMIDVLPEELIVIENLFGSKLIDDPTSSQLMVDYFGTLFQCPKSKFRAFKLCHLLDCTNTGHISGNALLSKGTRDKIRVRLEGEQWSFSKNGSST